MVKKLNQRVWITAENFNIKEDLQEGAKGFKIKGLALPFGRRSRNGGVYDKERTTQIAHTLEGKPVLFNHDENRVIGHVVNVSVQDEGLYYEADIDPEEKDIIRKIKRGDISNVSIQGIVDTIDEDNNIFLDEFVEMSIVTIPGFKETTITTIESLLKKEGKEEITKEPFAGFKDFDDCVAQMKKKQGYDDETAKKVCGMLKKKYEETLNEVSNISENNKSDNMEGEEFKELAKKMKEAKYFEEEGYTEAKYPWDQCIRDMKKRGYDDETAAKICAAIKNRTVKHLLDKNLANSTEEGIKIVSEVIGYNEKASEVSNKYPNEQDNTMEEVKIKEQDNEEVEEKEAVEEDFKEILEKIVERIDKIEERLSKVEKITEKLQPPEENEEVEESIAENTPKIVEKKELSPDVLREIIVRGEEK